MEGRTEGAPVVRPDRRGVRSRESVDSDSVLLHEDSVRGGEEDEESTNADV